jgi:RNA polymerase sigma factor (sigma-70 family)
MSRDGRAGWSIIIVLSISSVDRESMGAPHPPSGPPGLRFDPQDMTTSRHLIRRAREGDASAVSALLLKHVPPLEKWAHGRLPRWARTVSDTADLVQDALLNTLKRLRTMEPQGHAALQGYLRRAVDNRINDEFRRIGRRGMPQPLDDVRPDAGPSPLDSTVAAQIEDRYRQALRRLRPTDRRLIVGRVELGYSIEQLAVLTGRARTDSVRVALSRALIRLAAEMDGA